MGNSEDWSLVINPLRKTFPHFDFITPTLPGHSDVHFNFKTRKELYHYLGSFWNQTSADIVIGYSLGGRIALELSLEIKAPKLLIIESSSLGLKDEIEKQKRLNEDTLNSHALILNPESFLKKWWLNPIFGKLHQHPFFPSLLKKRIDHYTDNWAKAMSLYSTGLMPPLENSLTKLNTIDKFYFYGSLDTKYKKIANQQLKKHNWKLKEFTNSGHNCHFEKTEEFIKELTNIFSHYC